MSSEAISLETRRRAKTERVVHRGFTYDSYPEMLFAQALEARGVPFVPHAQIWISPQVRPVVDFLILYAGRAMVIEIHGRTYHPPNRMIDEWYRTRPLKRRKIGVEIEFIAAEEVIKDPGAALDSALELLAA